ncbi:hypothetical protein EZ428_23185 [Pedobacter frigiditerrae]|uniref:Uncharacterized protein n=1 Tax=Pedobacter frigiditerrae TaxID=2530452 RepID=A0A4R0MJY4_9SPHI|nr:DUF6252 family protein [Pedobacter frigiditerrae]TCC86617.1 hypothetical protein EZ428_23185 [Pedobacter frigiditerrae]
MKKRPIFLLSLACVFLSFAILPISCKKKTIGALEPALPAETQTGARTFGCLVNGEIWIPTGISMIPAITTSIQFDILSLKTNKGVEAVNFSVTNMQTVGSYDLITNSNFVRYIYDTNIYKCTDGTLVITKYDKINRIISGHFFFVGKDSATGKTIKITEGRFDVPFTN